MTGKGVLLLGPPGSGKGTQAQLLAASGGMAHLSTGDLLREEVKAGSDLGRQAQGYMNAGQLVPDSLLLGIVKARLRARGNKGFVLDGYPRNLAQASALDVMLKEMGLALDLALLLDVPEDELVARITNRRTCSSCSAVYHLKANPPAHEGICDTCGAALVQRPDDTEATVRKRLAVYEESTRPLIDLYAQRRILKHVIALGDIAAIQNQLRVIVGEQA
jgi:adenylate kinase